MSQQSPASFATAAQPSVADTVIVTDATGLVVSDVAVPTASGLLPGYLARPAFVAHPPILLVIQEIFGMHEHIRDVARRFARIGYLTLAPQLYHRQGDVLRLPDVAAIREVVARVPDAQVLADLDACLAYAEVCGGDPGRAFVTGFCWGGRISWLYAAHQPQLKAAVAWYGRLSGEVTALQPRHPIDVAAELKAPVLGLYGGQDAGIPLDSVRRMQTALERSPTESRIHLYPEAPHAFFADYRPSYRRAAAEDAFERVKRFLHTHAGARTA